LFPIGPGESGIDENNAGMESDTSASKKPVSERQLTANRENAQRSTGPQTDEGKAVSSKNACKSGIFIRHLLRPGEQREKDRAELEELVKALV
jgi:hypothetical protein